MAETATAAPQRVAGRPRLRGGALLGTVPFFAFVTIFLVIPTLTVIIGAFTGDGGSGFTLENVRALGDDYILAAFGRSITLSASSAVIGAILGALLAYALVTGKPDGLLRRAVTAAAGVLAQFGGVTLAFAFLATIGLSGFVTQWLQEHGLDPYANGVWLFELPGLTLVYTYFQIPLMVIVFLPALDGIRPQWREAATSLGGSTWHYWTRVAGPLLAPAFLGSALLLFANAFSAYATAAALVSQGSPIVPLQIRGALTSEVVLGQANLGKAMALGMVVVVAVVMALYSLLQKRTAKWLG
ncbi:ABC transporter permease [Actinoplanes couchii]|uniref:ABC transporter permease n=1 Tax=Actinoplanes couchii TaxID=403638 RepID=A0ABQ3X123_9ACTN|nr:ABC transporter permease subunit [Actinoplanes couchii]MDR6316611.1 putative spermidine/putrescine transport system permease protein [Actinoplanes couchii]GID52225.1 ABC transporter permease [Actinoplanes couchii]